MNAVEGHNVRAILLVLMSLLVCQALANELPPVPLPPELNQTPQPGDIIEVEIDEPAYTVPKEAPNYRAVAGAIVEGIPFSLLFFGIVAWLSKKIANRHYSTADAISGLLLTALLIALWNIAVRGSDVGIYMPLVAPLSASLFAVAITSKRAPKRITAGTIDDVATQDLNRKILVMEEDFPELGEILRAIDNRIAKIENILR